MKFCVEHNIPITPRGAGTGLSGGCVPSSKGIVISTEKLDSIDLHPDKQLALCGPGVITKALQIAAAEFGLTYPPDPASYGESTLGGNVAEGAGGLRCKRFGVTKDYVLGIEAVTMKGSLLKTGYYNDCAGMSLADLLIASEGTLAIITELALSLIPTPNRGTTILVTFEKPKDAAQTVSDITAQGIIPTVLEFLDGNAAACSNAFEKTDGLDNNTGAILLIETGAGDNNVETKLIRAICEANSCNYITIEETPVKAEELWRVRRNLSRAIKASVKCFISEDVAVPNTKFPELVDFVAQMNQNGPLRVVSFGHAGDGNLHAVFLSDDDSPAGRKIMDQQVVLLMRKTLELGGTLTGEHGIGLAKREFLPWEFDKPTIKAMRAIKEVFDPENLLNPDKLFDDTK